MARTRRKLVAVAPLEQGLQTEREQGEHREQGRHREGRDEVVFVVEDLDMQRQRVGQAADMARDHADCTELADGTRVAQQHAVEQAEADVRQRHAQEGLEARGTQRECGEFIVAALFLHQRNEFARNEGEGHEHGREHQPRHCEDDADVVFDQPRSEPALGTEDQDVDQARHHRRDRERQVDQRHQQGLAAEVVFADQPGRTDAEHQIQRHRDAGDQQGELQRGQRIGLAQRVQVGIEPVAQGFDEDRGQRQQQEKRDEGERGADQQTTQPARFGGGQGRGSIHGPRLIARARLGARRTPATG